MSSIQEETGIERHWREEDEAKCGYDCICNGPPHYNSCRVYNRRRLEELASANKPEAA